MATAHDTLGSEAERVERWREDALVRAGYPREDAVELAARADVDLHEAIDLLEQGCPPVVAVQILR